MIQRKQSLWLLLAALCNAGVFLFDLYRVSSTDVNGVVTQKLIRVADHFPSLLLALVMTILPLAGIFMFGNRKRQSAVSAMGMVATIAFITMTLTRVNNLEKATPPITGGSYWVGSVMPVVALVFIVMALAGIRKDEKLVRSMDRLR